MFVYEIFTNEHTRSIFGKTAFSNVALSTPVGTTALHENVFCTVAPVFKWLRILKWTKSFPFFLDWVFIQKFSVWLNQDKSFLIIRHHSEAALNRCVNSFCNVKCFNLKTVSFSFFRPVDWEPSVSYNVCTRFGISFIILIDFISTAKIRIY